MAVVTVATCQFPVSADIGSNQRHIARQMDEAAAGGADVAHFPEAALSGYAGVDFASFEGFDWDALRRASRAVLDHARELGLWVILGSAHPLANHAKPHNCLYIVDNSGAIVDRYDKRFCAGDAAESMGDLAHYTPGAHLANWRLNGVACGALICYDYRFPELYREYKRRGTQLIFHSFHAARIPAERMAAIAEGIGHQHRPLNRSATYTYPAITMPAAMTAEAAFNHVWISAPNSSAPQSCWPAFVVRADGVTVARARRNRAGVLLTTVDTDVPLYDSTAAWRDRAMAGTLHSGTLVSDPRSENRTAL
jgi:deaminated glutathione amidase